MKEKGYDFIAINRVNYEGGIRDAIKAIESGKYDETLRILNDILKALKEKRNCLIDAGAVG